MPTAFKKQRISKRLFARKVRRQKEWFEARTLKLANHMYWKLCVLRGFGSPNGFIDLLNVDNVSHLYEMKLLCFLLLAARILQNWADGHENFFFCQFVLNLVWGYHKQNVFEDVMVKKPRLFENRMDSCLMLAYFKN